MGGSLVRTQVESALLILYRENATGAAKAVIARSENTLSGHARTIGRDRDVTAALADGDKAQLEDTLASTFNRISAAGEISDLLIYDAEGALQVSISVADEKVPSALPSVAWQVFDTGRRAFGLSRIGDNRYAAPFAQGPHDDWGRSCSA